MNEQEEQKAEYYCGECAVPILDICFQCPPNSQKRIGVYVEEENGQKVGRFDPKPSPEVGQRIGEHFFRKFGLKVIG